MLKNIRNGQNSFTARQSSVPILPKPQKENQSLYGFIDKQSIDQNLKIISEKHTKENFYQNDSEIDYIPRFELIDDPYEDKFMRKQVHLERKNTMKKLKKLEHSEDSFTSSSNMSSMYSVAAPAFRSYSTVKRSRASLINDKIIKL